MSRTTTRIRPLGSVPYDELPGDIQHDVVAAVAVLTKEDEDEVRIGLENGPSMLPLVGVSPNAIFDANRSVSEPVVEAYAQALREGTKMPPVLIDSSRAPILALIEGGHRVAAAVHAGVPEISAIDLAAPRIVKREGLESYEFGKRPSRNK